ncbi:hypothetical protein LguiB_028502 [Lonicera macranthoides]
MNGEGDNYTYEDIDNDELSKIFGKDPKGRVRAIGSNVSKKQLIHLGIATEKSEQLKKANEEEDAMKNKNIHVDKPQVIVCDKFAKHLAKGYLMTYETARTCHFKKVAKGEKKVYIDEVFNRDARLWDAPQGGHDTLAGYVDGGFLIWLDCWNDNIVGILETKDVKDLKPLNGSVLIKIMVADITSLTGLNVVFLCKKEALRSRAYGVMKDIEVCLDNLDDSDDAGIWLENPDGVFFGQISLARN